MRRRSASCPAVWPANERGDDPARDPDTAGETANPPIRRTMNTSGRKRRALGIAVVLGASAFGGEPAELIDAVRALGMSGQAAAAGRVEAEVVPAPDGPPDLYSLRMRFRLDRHVQGQWINVFTEPSPPLDFSAATALRVPVRAEQDMSFLKIKLVDPDNPGPNHSAFEGAVSDGGGALPAGRWVDAIVPLPPDPARRDGLTYVGFYISAGDRSVPSDRDLVVYAGRFPLVLPPRPPWPPPIPAAGAEAGARLVWSGVPESGPWRFASGAGRSVDASGRGVVLRATANGWNELVRSDPDRLPLRSGITYRLGFDYRVEESPHGESDATFYCFARAADSIDHDAGWQRWTGVAGGTGRRTLLITPERSTPYHLVFGIRHQGAIRIEAVDLREIARAPEAAP